jgi:hypothetical protein
MISPNEPETPASGTEIHYLPGDPAARCGWCLQPRNPLFTATSTTHDLEGDDPAWVCARCWSVYHRDADNECQHRGSRLDEPVLW